jgi:hypothetical protein
MRKATSYNFSASNGLIQPEDFDPLRNIEVSYRSQYEIPKKDISLKLSDNKFSFLDAQNYAKQEK